MNTLKLADFQKIGFDTKVAGVKFIKDNKLRKSPKESLPQFLKRVKALRIYQKKENLSHRRALGDLGGLVDAAQHEEIKIDFNAIRSQNVDSYHGSVKEFTDEFNPKALTEIDIPQFAGVLMQRFTSHLRTINRERDSVSSYMRIFFRIKSSTGKDVRDRKLYHRKGTVVKNKYKSNLETEFEQQKNGVVSHNNIDENKLKNKHSTDDYDYFVNGSYQIIGTKIIKDEDISFDNLVVILSQFINKNHNSEDYNIYTDSAKFMFRLGSTSGGCTKNPYESNDYYVSFSDGILIKTTEYNNKEHGMVYNEYKINLSVKKSENNNCLFACFNEFHKIKGNVLKPDFVRKQLNIPIGTEITLDEIEKINCFYNKKFKTNYGFIVSNETSSDHLKIVKSAKVKVNDNDDIYKNTIPLFLYNNHYYLYETKTYYICETCLEKISTENTTHECNIKIATYVMKELKAVIVKKGQNQLIDEFIENNDFVKEVRNKNKEVNSYVLRYDKMNDEIKKELDKIKNENKLVEPYKSRELKKYECAIKGLEKYLEKSNSKEKQKLLEELVNMNHHDYYYNHFMKQIILSGDFETFPDELNKHHRLYAVGLHNSESKEYIEMFHENNEKSVEERFLDYLIELDESESIKLMESTEDNIYTGKSKQLEIVLCFYNGHRYDFHLFMDLLIKKGYNPNFLLANGRLLSLKFKHYKIFDLCAFLTSSLEDACEDFKISDDIKKGEFDFLRVQSYNDILNETVRKDCSEYLRRDVLSMVDITNKFNDIVLKECDLSIYNFMTLPQLAYSNWTQKLKKVVKIPLYSQWQKYIKKATYGGRTYPLVRSYTSKFYDIVKQINDKDALELIYEEIRNDGDFLVYGDVTSLYPSGMAGFEKDKKLIIPYKKEKNYKIIEKGLELEKVSCEPIKRELLINKPLYPSGDLIEIENNPLECEYVCEDLNLLGIFEITFTPPKNIVYPVLPSKKKINGKSVGVEWDLLQKSGMYSTIDIENALCMGYDVEYIGYGIYWTGKSDLFGEYVDNWYKLKDEAEKSSNPALRNASKLFLNSIYGKTFESPHTSVSQIISNIMEFDKFRNEYELTEFKRIDNEKYLLTGEKKDKNKSMTKPCQLGLFVTAYSRRIMLYYIYEMDPTLTQHTYVYGDTDSLLIYGKYAKILIEKGLLLPKEKSRLGLLCFDGKNEPIILRSINLAPKSYYYGDITKSSPYKHHYKCKGITNTYLKADDFLNEKSRLVKFNNPRKMPFKRIGVKPTSKNINDGLSIFSVYTNDKMQREFLKSEWKGFDLFENKYYPKGYNWFPMDTYDGLIE